MTIDLAQLDPRYFDRMDNLIDSDFYAQPRKVVHIDQGAIDAVTALYRELLPAGSTILDLMSSWRSHLPEEVQYARVCGLGMNEDELSDNPQLSDWLVHNLNQTPQLPFTDGEFAGVCCCVSVQYMQRPQEVFAEVARIVQPNAPFVITFSNRCFPTKAINLWRSTDDWGHIEVVESYFALEPGFRHIDQRVYMPSRMDEEHQDPLYAMWGFRRND
ncbi:MAG: methyltransferase domain-containing protein [Chloroflexota bacterium]